MFYGWISWPLRCYCCCLCCFYINVQWCLYQFYSYATIMTLDIHVPSGYNVLTHWGRVTHICVSKLTIIGSDDGLSPGRPQAIIWTNAGILLIRTLGTNFSEILGEIHSFSFSEMHLKMSSAKWRLFGLGLNELRARDFVIRISHHWMLLSGASLNQVKPTPCLAGASLIAQAALLTS